MEYSVHTVVNHGPAMIELTFLDGGTMNLEAKSTGVGVVTRIRIIGLGVAHFECKDKD